MPSPKVWGRHFWYTLHISALGYPDNPTTEQMNAYKLFYTNFGNILPCKKCSSNYAKHLKELPIDKALRSSKALFEWTVELHNIVNRYVGKASWTPEYAEAFYTSGSFNDCKCDSDEVNKVWRYVLILMVVINVLLVLTTLAKLFY